MTRWRQRWREFLALPGIRSTLAVALLCNLVLGAAYVWSRDGQITEIRTEVRGDEISVFIDGRLRIHTQMPAPDAGGVVVYAPNQRFHPATLAAPGSIESLRVTSLDTGDALFETHAFPRPTPAMSPSPPVVLDLSSRRWQNFRVDVRVRNVLDVKVGVLSNGKDHVNLQLIRYGFHSLSLTSTLPAANGQSVQAAALSEQDAKASAKGATAALLRPYPLALALAVALAISIVCLSRFLPREGSGMRLQLPGIAPLALASLLSLMVFGTTAFLLRHVLQGLPYVADEAAYLFQARLLASGQTHTSTPQIPDAFSFSYTPFIVDYEGRWAAFYTPGHPLALVPGTLIGAPWLMPPLIAAVNTLLLFGIGRKMFDPWTGVLVAALYACSPFALLQASSFMSHNTAIAFMLASVLAIVALDRRPYLAGGLGGLCFGMFFNTRPLSAVAFAIPLSMLLFWGLREREARKSQVQLVGAFTVAALSMFVAYLGYNWSVTGHALQNGYQAGGDLNAAFGFGGSHSVANGIDGELANLLVLVTLLNGWPAWLGLMFLFVPFVLGTRNAYDWFLLAAALFIFSSAAWFYTTGMVNGPRYVYEATPFLLLLTARGMVMLVRLPARIARAGPDTKPEFTTELVGGVLAVAACTLVAASAMGWLFSSSKKSDVPAAPSAKHIGNGRTVDGRLGEEAQRLDLHHALVVVQPCDAVRLCYLSVFLRNNITLDGDVVWVFDVGAKNEDLFRLYPCRSLYIATYQPLAITPTGRTASIDGEACD